MVFPPLSWTLERWVRRDPAGGSSSCPRIPNRRPYPPKFRRDAVRLYRSNGRSLKAVSEDLGVSLESLRHWNKQLDADEGRAGGVTSQEREELSRLRRENKILGEEARGVEKSRGLLRHREREAVAVYRFTAAEKANHPVSLMCRVLGVSRSGFHAWHGPRAQEDARLLARIEAIHAQSRATYGAPRIHAELRQLGVLVARKRVERLMPRVGSQGSWAAGAGRRRSGSRACASPRTACSVTSRRLRPIGCGSPI